MAKKRSEKSTSTGSSGIEINTNTSGDLDAKVTNITNVNGLIAPHPRGVVLLVRAQPGARRNTIQGEYRGALKIAVAVPPEDGRANLALIELLHEALHLRRSQISLLSGHTGRDKRFLIEGITVTELGLSLSSCLSTANAK